MTNQDLLQRKQTINQALQQDVFETTKIKYALTSNSKRLERALEAYQDQLEKLQEKHSKALEEIQERQQELKEKMEEAETEQEKAQIQQEMRSLEAPEEYQEEHEELLSMDAGDIEPYNVSDSYLDKEDDVDIQFLYNLDWMFVDSV